MVKAKKKTTEAFGIGFYDRIIEMLECIRKEDTPTESLYDEVCSLREKYDLSKELDYLRRKEDLKSIEKTKEYKEIREDLLGKLERLGSSSPLFRNMVEEYMDLYADIKSLQLDIDYHGHTVLDFRGMPKQNPAVSAVDNRLKSMLNILNHLHISTAPDQQIILKARMEAESVVDEEDEFAV